jgi:hypothetical protein
MKKIKRWKSLYLSYIKGLGYEEEFKCFDKMESFRYKVETLLVLNPKIQLSSGIIIVIFHDVKSESILEKRYFYRFLMYSIS